MEIVVLLLVAEIGIVVLTVTTVTTVMEKASGIHLKQNKTTAPLVIIIVILMDLIRTTLQTTIIKVHIVLLLLNI